MPSATSGRVTRETRESPKDYRLTFVPLAIGTALVSLEFQQALDRLLILGGPIRGRVGRSAGHG